MTASEEIAQLRVLLKLEQEHGLKQYNDALNNQSVEERKRNGVTWYPIDIAETGYGLGDYPWIIVERGTAKGHSGRFRGGSMVEFFRNAPGEDPVSCRGTVHWADQQRMKITLFNNELPDSSYIIKKADRAKGIEAHIQTNTLVFNQLHRKNGDSYFTLAPKEYKKEDDPFKL